MRNSSFKAYVAREGSAWQKEVMAKVKVAKTWGDVRMYVRQLGATDEELVKLRGLWRKFRDG